MRATNIWNNAFDVEAGRYGMICSLKESIKWEQAAERMCVRLEREQHAPKGEKPAEWLLLTTETISTQRQIGEIRF